MLPGFQCSYCGEWNVITLDESAGSLQRFVEDCQTCCQPNLLTVRYDKNEEQFVVRAEREN